MRDDWRDGNINAVAILRVSSRRQKDGISHDIQEREIAEYCAKNRLRMVEIFKIVESAKDSENRVKYQAAINTAVAKNYRHVLFYMYDREARNTTDTERSEKLVKSGIIVLHYVRESKVLHRGSADTDFYMRDIQAATNKHYSRNLSTRVGDAMRQKAESGWYPGNHAPLGYAHIHPKDEHGRQLRGGTTIGLDPNSANVRQVQREFELRAQGLSFQQVRNQIIEEGLVSPKRAAHYVRATLEKRLKNPFYAGRFIWQGEEFEGKHELIIPKLTLERVKAVNAGRRFLPAGIRNGVFAGGFLKCVCGCNVVYDPKVKCYRDGHTQTYHYYHCTNGRRAHASMSGLNVQEAEIWAQLDGAVDAISIDHALARQIAHALNEGQRRALSVSKAKTIELEAMLAATEAKEDRAYDDLTAGTLDAEGYRRLVARIRRERADYREQLDRAKEVSRGGLRESAQSTLELCTSAKALYFSRSPVERRMLLEKLVSNPVLDGKTVRYNLRKPFGVLSEMKESGKWRTLVDEFRTQLAAPLEF